MLGEVNLAGVFLLYGCAPQVEVKAKRAALLEADAVWSRAAAAKDVDGTVSFLADDASMLPRGRWFQDLDLAHSLAYHTDHGCDRDAQPSDTRDTYHLVGIDCDESKFFHARLLAVGAFDFLHPAHCPSKRTRDGRLHTILCCFCSGCDRP